MVLNTISIYYKNFSSFQESDFSIKMQHSLHRKQTKIQKQHEWLKKIKRSWNQWKKYIQQDRDSGKPSHRKQIHYHQVQQHKDWKGGWYVVYRKALIILGSFWKFWYMAYNYVEGPSMDINFSLIPESILRLTCKICEVENS